MQFCLLPSHQEVGVVSQKREAAIVGIYEYPLRKVGPGVTPLRIKAEAMASK